jgi:hypothetical protein
MRIARPSNNSGGTSFQNLSVILDLSPDSGESVAERISSSFATSFSSFAVTVGSAWAGSAVAKRGTVIKMAMSVPRRRRRRPTDVIE